MSQVKEPLATPDKGRQDLLVLLKEAQRKFGYLSSETVVELAQSLGLSASDVYGVATFYSFLSTRPLGRNVIRVCQSLPCFLRHSQSIIESVAREIGIRPGQTTADGRYSFQLTNCIGLCEQAPAMMINDDVHGGLTPGKISQILNTYK